MANVQNYTCPSCGGPLAFDTASGKLLCSYCNSTFDPDQIASEYSAGFDGNTEWKTESTSSDWGEDAHAIREYNCPSCGATIICDSQTAATSCPYCDNPTIVETQFQGSLRPDYIIPFKLKKEEAVNALKEFYRKKPLLPKKFAEENHLEEAKGIYVPFWFFDGTAVGSATFNASSSHTEQRGDETVRITKSYLCERSGEISFNGVPVDASRQMDDKLMDSIEPYDYASLTEFSTGFLPGYYADIHDVSAEECFPRANTRCAATFLSALRGTVKGYESVSLASKNISLQKGTVRYGLLPVYILNTKCNDALYTFAVNGQTGKTVGNLPSSKGKAAARFFRNFFIALAIAALAAFGLMSLSESPDVALPLGAFALFVALMTGVIGLVRDKSKMKTVLEAREADRYTNGSLILHSQSDSFKGQSVSVIAQNRQNGSGMQNRQGMNHQNFGGPHNGPYRH